jgi:hypothetical protein
MNCYMYVIYLCMHARMCMANRHQRIRVGSIAGFCQPSYLVVILRVLLITIGIMRNGRSFNQHWDPQHHVTTIYSQ